MRMANAGAPAAERWRQATAASMPATLEAITSRTIYHIPAPFDSPFAPLERWSDWATRRTVARIGDPLHAPSTTGLNSIPWEYSIAMPILVSEPAGFLSAIGHSLTAASSGMLVIGCSPSWVAPRYVADQAAHRSRTGAYRGLQEPQPKPTSRDCATQPRHLRRCARVLSDQT